MNADYHIHSDHSPDSITPMEVYCEKALSLGLDEICFTEHLDYDVDYDYPSGIRFTYERYLSAIKTLRLEYQGQLTIKAGIEFGVQLHTIDQFRKDYENIPLDFILMSSHEINNQEFWRQKFQAGKTQVAYNRAYYQNLLDMVKAYDGYSVLAHMDVIKRYDQNGVLDDEVNIDLIEEILKVVIEKGKGLEVNTSCVRYEMPDLTPSKKILSLYKKLGGTILTLGSDAHQVGQLGDHMEDIRCQLIELGFTHFHTFDKLKAIAHPL